MPAELVAYPLLLAASYGVYRVGRRPDAAGARTFDTMRLAFQGALFGVVSAVSHKLLLLGALEMPLGMFAPAFAIPALAGLIAIDVVQIARTPSPFPEAADAAVSG